MSRRLVTYFSAGGATGHVAEMLAQASEADLFEIRPEVPYTEKDIKWTNPLARCNKEKIGKKDVPIAEKIENLDTYDTVFIGFPIWYGEAPNVVHTFIKAHDFSGKKIALFATSGGSGISKCPDKIKPELSKDARIIDARLFRSPSEEELKAWAESI